jgi:hypothetical protein
MAEEKATWTQQLADAARQITTPIGLMAVFAISLTFISRGISGCELDSTWKGCLLTGVLVIFAAMVSVSLYLATFRPRNLTFDKDAHIAIDVTAKNAAKVATGLSSLMQDLEDAVADPGKLEEMAEKIKKEESKRSRRRRE